MTLEQLIEQVREQATIIARMGQAVHQHEQDLRPARSAPLLNRRQAERMYSPTAMRKQLGAGGAAPLDLSGLKGAAAEIQPAAVPEVPELPQLGDASVKQGTMLKAAGVIYRRGAQEWEPVTSPASQRGSGPELTAGGNPEVARAAGLMPPSAHHLTHQDGGNDEVATAVPGADAIPKAKPSGTLDSGWLPDSGVAGAYYTKVHVTAKGIVDAGTTADLGGAGNFGGTGLAADDILTWDGAKVAPNPINTSGAGYYTKVHVSAKGTVIDATTADLGGVGNFGGTGLAAGSILKWDGSKCVPAAAVDIPLPAAIIEQIYTRHHAAQAASIGATVIGIPAAGGPYELAVDLGVAVTGAGTVSVTFTWAQGGVAYSQTYGAINMATLNNRVATTHPVYCDAGTGISYSTAYAGPGTYNLNMTLRGKP